jgi:hypothetical protein
MSSDALILACSVCFGAADGPMLDAARLGVLVMVALTCGVLAAFGVFFVRIAKAQPSSASWGFQGPPASSKCQRHLQTRQ